MAESKLIKSDEKNKEPLDCQELLAMTELELRIVGSNMKFYVSESATQMRRPVFFTAPVSVPGGIQQSKDGKSFFLRLDCQELEDLRKLFDKVLEDFLKKPEIFDSVLKVPVTTEAGRIDTIRSMISKGRTSGGGSLAGECDLSAFMTPKQTEKLLTSPGETLFIDRDLDGGLQAVFEGLDGNEIHPKDLHGKAFSGIGMFVPRAYRKDEKIRFDNRLLMVKGITFDEPRESRKRLRDDPK